MRNGIKKILALACALGLACTPLVGCQSGTALEGDTSGEVTSNGGFVVEKGNYYYFINGADEYTADNTFGDVVKASLMRIAKSDLASGNYGAAQTVVPSLMVAGDHTSGIYIYGDRVYYATPTSAKNISGEVENSYLDFKSTKLDGTDTTSNYYFRSSENATVYRYVEVDNVVYCLHIENDTDLYSYNTETGDDTLLAAGMTSFTLATNKTDPGVYYTMAVTVGDSVDASYNESYTQIYYVRADATEAAYEYTFSDEYVEDYREMNGSETYPYVNYGTIVLDGYGSDCDFTQFNHNEGTEAYTPSGYTYTLVGYANGGLYYTRSYVDKTESEGDGGWLFYLADETVQADGWNAVSGNADTSAADAGAYNDIVAYSTTNASTSAIFLKEGDRHSYLYADGSAIFRADVTETDRGISTETLRIVDRASSATLMYTEEAGEFGYLYYSASGTNGSTLYRAVYNGEATDYNALAGDPAYKAQQILDIEFMTDWYLPEKIGDYLFFVNAEAIGSNSYNYACVMSLAGTNADLAAFNERYEEIKDEIADVKAEYEELGNLMTYYYVTGGNNPVFNRYYLDAGKTGATVYENTDYYTAILAQAKEEGYTDTYLYSQYFQDTFAAFMAKTGEYEGKFVDADGKDYGVQSYFYAWIGEVTDADMEAIDAVYETEYVKTLTEEEEETSALPAWAIALIAIGAAAVVGAVGTIVATTVIRNKKKAAPAVREEKLKVDTTDDKSVDVYADEEKQDEDK